MNKEIEEALEKVKEYAPEINAIGFNSNELNEDNTIFNNALDTLKDYINAQQDKLDRIKGIVVFGMTGNPTVPQHYANMLTNILKEEK